VLKETMRGERENGINGDGKEKEKY